MILKQELILNLHKSIETPALIVDQQQLEVNIESMQRLANDNGVCLRPHIKTHKSVHISKLLIRKGAIGITVAKISEAEVMAKAGISDIFIANQITHPLKLDRLKRLHHSISLSIGIDNIEQVKMLKSLFRDVNHPVKVLIEIDSGLHRCGLKVGPKLVELARGIEKINELSLEGLFTHAGQVYAAQSKKQLQEIGELEGSIMAQARNFLASEGINVNVVSVGSTPTVAYSSGNPSVTEIRPGNYVFNDNIQYVLESCTKDQWALAVLATVVSQPEPNRIVIDAGSKALNLDRGANASQLITGYGKLLNIEGEIVRLSEEHGVINLQDDKIIPLGSPVLIIPNHACAVANLFSDYQFIEASGNIIQIPVDARGMSQ